jgi:hypothetical protein
MSPPPKRSTIDELIEYIEERLRELSRGSAELLARPRKLWGLLIESRSLEKFCRRLSM